LAATQKKNRVYNKKPNQEDIKGNEIILFVGDEESIVVMGVQTLEKLGYEGQASQAARRLLMFLAKRLTSMISLLQIWLCQGW
jgi:hypothetical protein